MPSVGKMNQRASMGSMDSDIITISDDEDLFGFEGKKAIDFF